MTSDIAPVLINSFVAFLPNQVLRLIISNFPPSFYSANSNALIALMKMADDTNPRQVGHHSLAYVKASRANMAVMMVLY